MTVTLIESPDLKRSSSWTSPLRAVTAPINTFQRQATAPRPLPVLVSVVLLTAIATATTGPMMSRLLQDTQGINASSALANQFVLAQVLFFAPIGTTTFLVFLMLWIWGYVVMTGDEMTLAQAGVVVFTAGVTGVMKRLFVTLILHLRLFINPAQLTTEVTSGLDGFVREESVGRPLYHFMQQAGIFEIWFFVLIGIGLHHTAGITARRALLASVLTALLVTTARTVLSLATS